MIDELKVRLAEQGIEFDEYLKVTERDEAKLREESREGAEHRVKVLLVLGAVADAEGVEVPDEAIEAEIERSRQSAARSSGDPDASRKARVSSSTSSPSAAARTSARTLRRSQIVEGDHRPLDRGASRSSPTSATSRISPTTRSNGQPTAPSLSPDD